MSKNRSKVIIGNSLITGLILCAILLSNCAGISQRSDRQKQRESTEFLKPSKNGTTETKVIYTVDDTFTWLREPLIIRLPDGSLLCEIFTGGTHDGGKGNVVAAVRSDDDGETWSNIEVLKAKPDTGCWASSVFVTDDAGYIFWYTMDKARNNMTNTNAHLLVTGADGRSFTEDKGITGNWDTSQCVDVRRGTTLKNGKILLPASWKEVIPGVSDKPLDPNDPKRKRMMNFGGSTIMNKISYCGVLVPNEDFTEFKRFGQIHKLTPEGDIPSVPFFENQIAELSDGSLAMLLRADLTNRIWRSNSFDGGETWSEPVITDILNPGSKFLLMNLPNDRIILFHNPSEKDYEDLAGHHHKYRTPLEIWISDDDMKTWSIKETLVEAPDLAMYPDGFYDAEQKLIYLVWEDEKSVFFKKIKL